jgi:hypothetical protein
MPIEDTPSLTLPLIKGEGRGGGLTLPLTPGESTWGESRDGPIFEERGRDGGLFLTKGWGRRGEMRKGNRDDRVRRIDKA